MREALLPSQKENTTDARLSSVSLADFFAREDLADFILEVLLDFLGVGFTHSVCNILSYLKGTVQQDGSGRN